MSMDSRDNILLHIRPPIKEGLFVGWAISRSLSTTIHPIEGQGGSTLLVHYSVIILKPAIFGLQWW